MINWILHEERPYDGTDPTLDGASFDRYKFYSPAMVSRVKFLGAVNGRSGVNSWLRNNMELWPDGDMDGMQFDSVDGDWVICTAISV